MSLLKKVFICGKSNKSTKKVPALPTTIISYDIKFSFQQEN